MKHIYLNTKRKLTIAIAIVLFNTSLYSQTIPELVFTNGTKIGSIADGADGAVYWFKNVGTGIDAFVKINGRSHSNVVLNILDETGTGYNNSFQPKIGYTGGSGYSNSTITDWYLEFRISFVNSNDTSLSIPVTTFNATALDIDGSSSGNSNSSNYTYLHEAYSFYGLTSYTTENNTTLSVSNVPSGKRFEAGNDEYDGIDVDASRARVTTKYDNTSSFVLRIGGKAKGPVSVSTGRQYSVWFRGFTYTTPVNTPLPVDLLSFNARLSNKYAVLDWATTNEKDFSHFVIERSTDGKSFDEAGILFSDGNSSSATKSYSFTDKADVQSTIVYYRLKMVDVDARYKYSEVRLIRKAQEQSQASVVVFPNPVVNELRVTIPNDWQNKNVSYTIFNSNGNVVKQKISSHASQTEIFNLTGAPAGLYMIKITKDTETITKQIVKQN